LKQYITYSDEQLLELLKSNDEVAFTVLFQRYSLRLIETGFYYTENKAVVEEIINDIFLRIWNKRSDLKIHSFKEYLMSAVKFGIFKFLLKEKRQKQLILGLSVSTALDDTIAKIEARSAHEYLNKVVEELPETTKNIFVYRREEELSVNQIADVLNMKPKAVEYHLTKSAKTLRAAWYNMDMIKVILIAEILTFFCCL
jgi:RNA polymerase sigma factor (sigma-70 family)